MQNWEQILSGSVDSACKSVVYTMTTSFCLFVAREIFLVIHRVAAPCGERGLIVSTRVRLFWLDLKISTKYKLWQVGRHIVVYTRYNLIVVHDVTLEFIMALVKNQFLGSRLIFGLKLSLSERWSYNALLLKREQFIALFVVTCWP